ncbi:putative protein DA1 [Rosa chinensis]|uniref:Protein DA1-like domain-containing protein n=1 Tax=Rosa chinensis TaxID=74649 RepID=A0A2P6S2E2_ROSCH|nr:putative protein DA1 [Rosa chinensis]
MMHAWLHLQDCRKKLEEKVEEGICEVMCHKWMERFCSSDDLDHSSYKTYKQGQFKRKLKQLLVESMETRPDIYGQGYREATRAIEKFGFQTTLNHIVQKESFPHREK